MPLHRNVHSAGGSLPRFLRLTMKTIYTFILQWIVAKWKRLRERNTGTKP